MIPSPPPGRMLSPKALMADPGTKIRGGRARGSSRPSLASPIYPGVALCFSSQSPALTFRLPAFVRKPGTRGGRLRVAVGHQYSSTDSAPT